MSVLSRPAIKRHIEAGNIVVEPFDERNVGTSSYDVSLGEYYFEEGDSNGGMSTYNIYSEQSVRRVWGESKRAQLFSDWADKDGLIGSDSFIGILPTDRVIWLPPGKTFLCHTSEFIGGRICVTTMMKARSSMGRNFIEVCKCAGMGDVGYINRWTMEVTNNSRNWHIPLVVGRRIAQIVFFDVEPLEDDYAKEGKYQSALALEELRSTWSPEMMLPRAFMDREAAVAETRRQLLEGLNTRSRPSVNYAFPPIDWLRRDPPGLP